MQAQPGLIQVFQTVKDSADRLGQKPALAFAPGGLQFATVLVDSGPRFQTIEGFGGAFTEAAAATFYRLPPDTRHEILRAYFDPAAGHGYRLCRTHINSCDFALGNYEVKQADKSKGLKLRLFGLFTGGNIPHLNESSSQTFWPVRSPP